MTEKKRFDAYIICTSPRSGSTLLCRLLAATGKTGNPDSHFHSPSISDWMRYYQISPDQFATEQKMLTAIFHAARDRGIGNSGIFGLRLQRKSFDYFIEKLRAIVSDDPADADIDCVQSFFGNTLFIHLTRASKLNQAISYVKATQSGLWHRAPDGTEIERLSTGQDLVYDPNAIARNMAEMTEMDARWNSWFAVQGIDPIRIRYDDLASDPRAVLTHLLHLIGVDEGYARNIKLPVAKLADETNKTWAARFLSEQHDQD